MDEIRNDDNKKETRNTRQKKLIIDCLNKYGSNHMTVEEIFNLIQQQDTQISIATVYRNLRLLEEQGLVNKVFVADDATAYYEIKDAASSHSHHHLICRQCGAIIDFEDDLLEALEKMITLTKGFQVQDHHVAFYGICRDCTEKNKAAQDAVEKPAPDEARQ
ncbi:MAG: transcriptional repressor [Clostridia bacterium]|nr:transcriptional repressor [Clostridia bacterium]MDR3643855.1 transcriptional repressor [Clostridia bacterium]